MIETLPALLAGAVLVAAFSIIIGLLLMGFDRIVAARMQARIGPPLTQPFTDVRKLLAKENVVPENAIPWLFNLAPIIALASAITILFYLPIGGFAPVLSGGGDLILVMYLLTLPALALVAGGFASGSPYATVGAQREMVTMIAYEFPLAIVVVAIAWRLAAAGISLPFSLATIGANPVWGLVGPLGAIGLLILLIVLVVRKKEEPPSPAPVGSMMSSPLPQMIASTFGASTRVTARTASFRRVSVREVARTRLV